MPRRVFTFDRCDGDDRLIIRVEQLELQMKHHRQKSQMFNQETGEQEEGVHEIVNISVLSTCNHLIYSAHKTKGGISTSVLLLYIYPSVCTPTPIANRLLHKVVYAQT